MNKIDAWWFRNEQPDSAVIQPDFFKPQSHFGIYAELEKITVPFTIGIIAVSKNGEEIYRKQLDIVNENPEGKFELSFGDRVLLLIHPVNDNYELPARLVITYSDQDHQYTQTVDCRYATLTGTITDFNGKPFQAAFKLYRHCFDNLDFMGVWSDVDGRFSITVPQGIYNVFYLDDDSYRKTSLECWGWHMIVDGDEEFHFKIGNGEVYSMAPWVSNGGISTMFIFFRPMILGKDQTFETTISGRTFKGKDICPDLELEDIRVTLNGCPTQLSSLQRIYETGLNGGAMPAYVVQIAKWVNGSPTVGKQTLILEYDNQRRKDNDNNIILAQSQGLAQFYFSDGFATFIE